MVWILSLHLFHTHRKAGQNLHEYVAEFEARYNQLEKLGEKLSSRLLALFLLKHANLTDTEFQIVTANLNFSSEVDAEVNKLFEVGYSSNALNLQRAMWWKITISFGYRARNESRKLCFGDIKLCTDTNGVKYLEWDKELGSKTGTGEKCNSHQCAFNLCVYATDVEQCPSKIYALFCKKRPE